MRGREATLQALQLADVEVLQVDAADDFRSNLLGLLPACIDFIKLALAAGKTCLVHCHMGVSRSATVSFYTRVEHFLERTRV